MKTTFKGFSILTWALASIAIGSLFIGFFGILSTGIELISFETIEGLKSTMIGFFVCCGLVLVGFTLFNQNTNVQRLIKMIINSTK